jgi:hypothetical protein
MPPSQQAIAIHQTIRRQFAPSFCRRFPGGRRRLICLERHAVCCVFLVVGGGAATGPVFNQDEFDLITFIRRSSKANLELQHHTGSFDYNGVNWKWVLSNDIYCRLLFSPNVFMLMLSFCGMHKKGIVPFFLTAFHPLLTR